MRKEREFLVVKRAAAGHSWATSHWSLNEALKSYHKVVRNDPLDFKGIFRRDPFLALDKCALPVWAGCFKSNWRVAYKAVELARGAFEQGYKAYGERKGVTANPYPHPGTKGADFDPYWQWYNGWRKADREDGN